MEAAIDSFTESFFKYYEDVANNIKSDQKHSSSTHYQRISLTNNLSDGLAYCPAQGLMQYSRIYPRPNEGSQHVPLFPGGQVKIASATFLPSLYPKSQFLYAKELAPLFNTLANNLSSDPNWLIEQLSPMALVDDYIKKLINICYRVYVEGGKDFSKSPKLHIFRSDYMTHLEKGESPTLQLKQIELNVVSVSCASYVDSLSPIHKVQLQNLLQSTSFFDSKEIIKEVHPENSPLSEFGSAFLAAQNVYKSRFNPKFPLAIMWLVNEQDMNEVDHRRLAFTLQNEYGLTLIRSTFNELYSMMKGGSLFKGKQTKDEFQTMTDPSEPLQGSNSSQNSNLFITEKQGTWKDAKSITYEIAIIYLRHGYSPDHFTSDNDWEIYEWLESSDAIKTPAVPTLLAGMKKIQQTWCDHQLLAKFSNNSEEIEKCFALQIDCNDTSQMALQTMKKAIENPGNYVLKPQREGGGNNLHDEDLSSTLAAYLKSKDAQPDAPSEQSDVKSEFILMEKIKPPIIPTIHFRTPYPSNDDQHPLTTPQVVPSISELGIYGVAVYDGQSEIMNKYAGYLLRTKNSSENEGGFVTGVSSMDSLYIYDDSKHIQSLLKIADS